MGNPLVTVICNTYNHVRYIRQTLDSFVSQVTGFEYEILVHDDASTDGTSDIVREFEQRYPCVHAIIQKENQYSQGHPRIDFIKNEVHGKYIALCEGDDFWICPDKLSIQAKFLEDNPEYDMCVHQSVMLNCQTGEAQPFSVISENRDLTVADIMEHWGQLFQTSSILLKRDLYLNPIEFLDYNGRWDYALAIKVCGGGKVRYMNSAMSLYRFFSCDTSWTSRQDFGNEKRYIKEINMLEAADAFFEYRYHDVMWPKIAMRKYWVEGMIWEKGFWKKDYMKTVFETMPVIERIKILVKIYIPFVYSLHSGLRDRNK